MYSLTGAAQRVPALDREVQTAPTTNAPAPFRKHTTQTGALTPEAASVLFAIAHRTADASNASALFAAQSWYSPPPPPPAPTPAPAAAPTAPPLPFTFLGRYTDGNSPTVYFLTRDDRVYDVKPGDAIDATYSVESFENGQLIFLYKPLNVRQGLPTGDNP